MNTETRWVIVGEVGLYTGAELTKREAITNHVEALYVCPQRISRDEAWKLCRKKGDRAIKVDITYVY